MRKEEVYLPYSFNVIFTAVDCVEVIAVFGTPAVTSSNAIRPICLGFHHSKTYGSYKLLINAYLNNDEF